MSPRTLPREEVIELLRVACELEHLLSLQYLFASFSLKRAGDTGVTPVQATLTEQWGQQLGRIAEQEMYHLLLANDVRIALGSPPHLTRPLFPQPATAYSGIGLKTELTGFDVATVDRFLCWEKPDVAGWWDSYCTALGHCPPAATATDAPYDSIGALYNLIKESILANPGWIDAGSARRQVTGALIPFTPFPSAITTAQHAADYIDIIVLEGEGTPEWQSTSHFAYFHQIRNQLRQIADSEEPFEPGLPTTPNPVYEADGPERSLITDRGSVSIGLLFNRTYDFLVDLLRDLFGNSDEDGRRDVANLAMSVMPLAIDPLGRLLTRLPAGPAFPGRTAGPSFELAVAVTPSTRPALRSSLVTLIQQCRLVAAPGSVLPPSARDVVRTVGDRLEARLPVLDFGHQAVALP